MSNEIVKITPGDKCFGKYTSDLEKCLPVFCGTRKNTKTMKKPFTGTANGLEKLRNAAVKLQYKDLLCLLDNFEAVKYRYHCACMSTIHLFKKKSAMLSKPSTGKYSSS